ncbi:unnamed protein product [Amoebophrya sp. A120]|nr:unnamed protein product [Amoebophrya sp. A120]|eukprot:GSA120T00014389001.1
MISSILFHSGIRYYLIQDGGRPFGRPYLDGQQFLQAQTPNFYLATAKNRTTMQLLEQHCFVTFPTGRLSTFKTDNSVSFQQLLFFSSQLSDFIFSFSTRTLYFSKTTLRVLRLVFKIVSIVFCCQVRVVVQQKKVFL